VTFAQDQESCVVFGMPGEAVRLGGAQYMMPPEAIAAAVVTLAVWAVGQRRERGKHKEEAVNGGTRGWENYSHCRR
jgi:hypothetical protein